MGLLSLPAEVLISLIAILIATVIGCATAILAWARITKETEGVKKAEAALTADSAWDEAYPHGKLELEVWLREKSIKPDSHLGDFIRTCWSAWLGGRPASLTELHVLVARRERGHGATRLSSGIAALLLVFGIVGTLSSIKPVLHEFKFSIAEENNASKSLQELDSATQEEENESTRDDASVAANTELVNTLIHNLGNAFWPSLLALIGTILVVSCRGLYTLNLHKFALVLDRFAVDILIPRYRVPSLSEQYQEVKATLTNVTEVLLQREERFHEVVGSLESMVEAISPALIGLDAAAVASKSAAEALSSRSQSIADGLTRHLGVKSPIHRAMSSFESIFDKTEKSLSSFACSVDEIGESTTKNQDDLKSAIQALSESIGRIAEDQKSQQSEAKSTLEDLKVNLYGIAEIIRASSAESTKAGMEEIDEGLTLLREELKKMHSDSTRDLKATTLAELSGITKTGKELVALGERVATSASNIEKMKEDAQSAFRELTDAGKVQITQSGDTTKSRIEATSAQLASDAARISTEVERLSKLSSGNLIEPIAKQWEDKNTKGGRGKNGRGKRVRWKESQNEEDTESNQVPHTDQTAHLDPAAIDSWDPTEKSADQNCSQANDAHELVEITDNAGNMELETINESRGDDSVNPPELGPRSRPVKKWLSRNLFSRKKR